MESDRLQQVEADHGLSAVHGELATRGVGLQGDLCGPIPCVLPGKPLPSGCKEFRPTEFTSRTEKADSHGAVPKPTFTTEQIRFPGTSVVRSPHKLHLHAALVRLNLVNSVAEFNQTTRLKGRSVNEPILITSNGSVISGFSHWNAAIKDSRSTVDCIELSLSDEEAIEFMLIHDQPQHRWNNFTRTRLALELESYFHSKALANQIAGGKYKGSANLPTAEHIDVRQVIANLAVVSPRNVSNVKTILKRAHSQLIEALHNGTIKINRALQLCEFERSKQVEELARFLAERSSSKTIRQFVDRLRSEQLSADMNVFLTRLQELESTNPGSVEVRPGTRKKTVIFVSKEHLSDLASVRRAGSV